MTKKPRNKKYNPRKSFELAIRNAVFITFISEEEDGEKVCVCNIATPKMRDAIIEHRGDWIIQLGLICQDSDDNYYSKETYLTAKDTRINELTDDYQRERDALCDSGNANHTIDFGWVIKPYSASLARRVENETEKTVMDYWLERQAKFERQTLKALAS